MRVLRLAPAALAVGAALIGGLLVGGCSGQKADDGTKNPEATRLTNEQFEQKRAKKGEEAPARGEAAR